ncbi:hypothetical protein BCON_0180g00140 [Botryotinia convoluta]|uniref:Uncharacterized protein n=1 Tax=Botryotinia convoluta TaxID=54673 RepID=A0A4Z1HNG7_9HELO|nr:hypothetical protein BCON_0180g00140 [Botryotinia convoluta]
MAGLSQQKIFRAAGVCAESGHSQSASYRTSFFAESVLVLVQSRQGPRNRMHSGETSWAINCLSFSVGI